VGVSGERLARNSIEASLSGWVSDPRARYISIASGIRLVAVAGGIPALRIRPASERAV